MWAIKNKKYKAAKVLILHGADVNHKDNESTYLIHYAVHSKSIKFIKLLIDTKVNLQARDQYGLTALVYALKNKDKDVIDLIKNAGGEY